MVPDPVARWNERIKLFAGFVNAVGLGIVGFGVLRPLTEDILNVSLFNLWWALAGLAMHGLSHYILHYMRKAAT